MKLIHSLIYILTAILFLMPAKMLAQITIGSAQKPNTGALLDLKENADGTSEKGLGLPRVSLKGNKILTIANGGTANTDHIGALVYNVNSIETSEAERLCPGVHVWDGEKWQSLTPYTEIQIPPSLANPQPDMVDPRDNETYNVARFHSVIVNNPYACEQEKAVTVIDAGIWMTQNLRYTKGLVNSVSDNYVTMQYYNPANTGADAARVRANGKTYNWAAASAQKGNTTTGQGNVDNSNNAGQANNEDGTTELGRNQLVRQGICPPGWHLPSDAEYIQLVDAIKAEPLLYSTQSTASDGNVGNAMKASSQGSGAYLGTSKPSDQGGFSLYLVGYGTNSGNGGNYGAGGYYWTSSSNSSIRAWAGVVTASSGGFLRIAYTRTLFYPVRCKKN